VLQSGAQPHRTARCEGEHDQVGPGDLADSARTGAPRSDHLSGTSAVALHAQSGQYDRVVALAYSEVTSTLRVALPEFAGAIDGHVADYDEVLPHVLFGDLTRFVLDGYQRGDDDLVRRALAFLDSALREGDDAVQNLVGVSFVENVGPWDPDQAHFIAGWPDCLRLEAEQQRDWRRT
jgi:hypothetical protein